MATNLYQFRPWRRVLTTSFSTPFSHIAIEFYRPEEFVRDATKLVSIKSFTIEFRTSICGTIVDDFVILWKGRKSKRKLVNLPKSVSCEMDADLCWIFLYFLLSLVGQKKNFKLQRRILEKLVELRKFSLPGQSSIILEKGFYTKMFWWHWMWFGTRHKIHRIAKKERKIFGKIRWVVTQKASLFSGILCAVPVISWSKVSSINLEIIVGKVLIDQSVQEASNFSTRRHTSGPDDEVILN